ncbi:hypothetical protein F441_10379 [Phytophthora nicotianae CJ01A1]|uniref:Uncharacterized protein n=1 Tax=Phytophthora nicotianae CJ01A1 TaxID=1317063 RepID=W2WW00_PHYNI|nr:hypothetical protein F441_10379 [Phytophthora nicotianae CJ01A1]
MTTFSPNWTLETGWKHVSARFGWQCLRFLDLGTSTKTNSQRGLRNWWH